MKHNLKKQNRNLTKKYLVNNFEEIKCLNLNFSTLNRVGVSILQGQWRKMVKAEKGFIL